MRSGQVRREGAESFTARSVSTSAPGSTLEPGAVDVVVTALVSPFWNARCHVGAASKSVKPEVSKGADRGSEGSPDGFLVELHVRSTGIFGKPLQNL